MLTVHLPDNYRRPYFDTKLQGGAIDKSSKVFSLNASHQIRICTKSRKSWANTKYYNFCVPYSGMVDVLIFSKPKHNADPPDKYLPRQL